VTRTIEPALVGSYPAANGREFLPVSGPELGRTQFAIERVLGSFPLAYGRFVLLISLLENGAYAQPFERAIMNMGLLCTNADDSRYEAVRIESICRRFDVAAVVGVSAEVLTGLDEAGFALDAVFRDRIVWARADAFDRLSQVPGIRSLRLMAEVGPAFALQCSAGEGVHVDSIEWYCTASDGAIVLSSRLLRATPFEAHRSEVPGALIAEPCPCGNADLRLALG